MKIIKTVLFTIAITYFGTVNSQEKKTEAKLETKTTYYQKRAKEDAKFEQEYTAETKKEEKKFWKDQKAYEKELKRKDNEAYEAYMQGKRDAYAEHHNHCNDHCNHGRYYHNHVTFYYYSEYRRAPRSKPRTRTTIRVGVPSVRVGLF